MIDDASRKLLRNMVLCGQAVFIAWAIVILDGRQTIMDAIPYLLIYTILMVVLWCLYTRKFGNTGNIKTPAKVTIPEEGMPKCPCCGRPCYPVTDISGRQMCSWCGHYIRYRGRYGFYRNILNYLNNIDDVVI